MSTDPIRIGFIGAGAICRAKHLPGLATVDAAQVIAVSNRSRASAQAFAGLFLEQMQAALKQVDGRPTDGK